MTQIIVSWTAIETNIAMSFAILLNGRAEVSLDVYHAMVDIRLRIEVFTTVLKRYASNELVSEFHALFQKFRRVAKLRHIVAHATWCHTDTYPDAICTLDAKYITQGLIDIARAVRADPSDERITLNSTFVGRQLFRYERRDFNDIITQMNALSLRSRDLSLKLVMIRPEDD